MLLFGVDNMRLFYNLLEKHLLTYSQCSWWAVLWLHLICTKNKFVWFNLVTVVTPMHAAILENVELSQTCFVYVALKCSHFCVNNVIVLLVTN